MIGEVMIFFTAAILVAQQGEWTQNAFMGMPVIIPHSATVTSIPPPQPSTHPHAGIRVTVCEWHICKISRMDFFSIYFTLISCNYFRCRVTMFCNKLLYVIQGNTCLVCHCSIWCLQIFHIWYIIRNKNYSKCIVKWYLLNEPQSP